MTSFSANGATAVQSVWTLCAALQVGLGMEGGQRNGREPDGVAAATVATWGQLNRQLRW